MQMRYEDDIVKRVHTLLEIDLIIVTDNLLQ